MIHGKKHAFPRWFAKQSKTHLNSCQAKLRRSHCGFIIQTACQEWSAKIENLHNALRWTSGYVTKWGALLAPQYTQTHSYKETCCLPFGRQLNSRRKLSKCFDVSLPLHRRGKKPYILNQRQLTFLDNHCHCFATPSFVRLLQRKKNEGWYGVLRKASKSREM